LTGCWTGDGNEGANNPSPGSSPTAAVSADVAGLSRTDRGLHATLDSRLSVIAAGLPASMNGRTAFGAELLSANGNAGESLLTPQAMQSVRTYLDGLQRLGVQGVSVQIADPLLAPDFPRSAECLRFYREVADEVRRRGLLLMVETGPVFAGTEYSSVRVGDRWPANEAYFRDRSAQIVTIATEIKPEHLSMGNEPQTEQMLTGLKFTLDEYIGFLQRTAAAAPRGATKLGAGTGTWEDPAWARRILAHVSVDFLDLHQYPLTNGITDYTQRLVDLTREAKAKGKDVVIGEAWLYKSTDAELGQGQAVATKFGRDYFDVWASLDARFIDTIGRLADREGVSYVSFFWSKYFFAYLAYSQDLASRPAAELIRLSNQAASAALQQGTLTAAGEALKKLTAGFKGR